MPYRMNVRKFLNRRGYHAGAYVMAAVEDSTRLKDADGHGPWLDIRLTLSDCSRVVSYDFDLETAGARRNSLHKIDLLVETLERFREALHEEATLAQQRERVKS